MFDLAKMTPEELQELGEMIGRLAQTRPDIAHRVIFGVRDGLNFWGKTENLGDILWMLWRHGKYHIAPENLSIPFWTPIRSPSGTIK